MTKTATHSKKCLRPSEIQKSDRMVASIVKILCTLFINPFDSTLDAYYLYNIVSGAQATTIVCESLTDLEDNGNAMKRQFEARIISGSEMTSTFYSTLKQFKLQNFENTNVKTVVTKNGKDVEIAYQRDIMGILVSQSYTSKAGVDIEKVLAFPLAPVSIPLCTSDGQIRKTSKSKLYNVAMKELTILDITTLSSTPRFETYFLDLVATIRTMSNTMGGTIRQLAWKIVDMIPKQFKYIYLVCDTYGSASSIKNAERTARGTGRRYIIKSPDMKVPYEFSDFLRNGDNKAMLLNLIEQALIEDSTKLIDRTIFYSNKDDCTRISTNNSCIIAELASDHEEADTKLVALVKASQLSYDDTVLIRSPSGDIDVLVLFLMHSAEGPRILVDNGTGKSRKIIDISTSGLSSKEREALGGMHAFSGNDYVSSFFRKGKAKFWKEILNHPEFVDVFSQLGTFNAVTPDLQIELERFVCILYGYPKYSSVNQVRKCMFINKFQKEHKTMELCNLPPCLENLLLHISRSNYVANIYERADRLNICLDNPCEHGWDEKGIAVWSTESFPEDVADLLLNFQEFDGEDEEEENIYDEDDDDDVGESYESDTEND